jgi:aspartate-semialdehyde dehydrogenase
MVERIPVAVLGATGSVGQRFVQLLEGHPWFEVVELTGSARSVGQIYGRACHWILSEEMPEWAKGKRIVESNPEAMEAKLVFSALPSNTARQLEPSFAQKGVFVFSNASAFRTESDVPLLLPEVNPEHASLVLRQQRQRGWTGGIVTNPNCTSAGMTVVLKALDDAFGVRRASVVSLQALSGAGLPGVSSIDIIDNVIPYIEGEEQKVAWEPLKMLGRLENEQVALAQITISAQCNRVAVSDGHIVCLSVDLDRPVEPDEAERVLSGYQAPDMSRALPSAPRPAILVQKEPERPQPRLDRMKGNGMTTVVGRLRSDPIMHLKMVILSHNTIRGAAGGSIYNAELLVNQGLALPEFHFD